MRNELVEKSDFSNPEKDKVTDVLNKSRETALQRYEHPIYDSELGLGAVGWYRLISRTPVQYTPQQFAVFRAVHKWRDDVARAEDESTVFIMPNHAVFSIARMLPHDKAELFNVTQHVSPILRQRADELVAVIEKAKDVGSDAPDLNETIKRISDLKFPELELPRVTKKAIQESTTTSPAVQPASTLATLDSLPLRAGTSTFWGNLWSGGAVQQRRPMSTLDIDFALPLPPLTAEIFTDGHSLPLTETSQVEKLEHTYVPKEDRPPEDERTDIFIVKQLGGKRKRRDTETVQETDSDMVAAGADEVMLDEDEPAAPRRREKDAKKAAKAAAKEHRRQEALANAGGLNYDDEPAFDYASAPSVLNAREAERRASGGKQKKEKKKPSGFNPYAKLTDAPKGLPRAQKEKAGKSKTFGS
jgi:exosome complex exonuclease RRP6